VATRAATLQDEAWVRDRVDASDPRVRRRKSVQIVGPPFDRIVGCCREAADLALRWLNLEESRPVSQEDFRVRQAMNIRDRLTEIQPDLAAMMAELIAPAQPLPVRAAARVCLDAIDDLGRLFDAAEPLLGEEACGCRVLESDLWRVPTIPVDEQGRPEVSG